MPCGIIGTCSLPDIPDYANESQGPSISMGSKCMLTTCCPRECQLPRTWRPTSSTDLRKQPNRAFLVQRDGVRYGFFTYVSANIVELRRTSEQTRQILTRSTIGATDGPRQRSRQIAELPSSSNVNQPSESHTFQMLKWTITESATPRHVNSVQQADHATIAEQLSEARPR